MSALRGGILIGGASERMGQPKATMLYRGLPLIAHVDLALRARCASVLMLGSESLPDAAGVDGPLAGILAALDYDADVWWVIAACDMPLINEAALDWLLGHQGEAIDAVIPRDAEGHLQPLLALYHGRIGPPLRGLTAPRQAAQLERVATPLIPEALQQSWVNVNTPEAFRSLP